MKRERYDLFQFDPTDPANSFPYYERSNGYTKGEADSLIKQMQKVGCYLTKRVRK